MEPPNDMNEIESLIDYFRGKSAGWGFVQEESVMKFEDELRSKLHSLAAKSGERVLEDYTKFLTKHGYCDADVYAEEPTAIERFLAARTLHAKEGE
jgi:hypothetical protein